MKMKQKKAIKLIALLITSLLIGFASVAAYTELFMYGTDITIGTAGVYFVAGLNTTDIGSISGPGTEVTFDSIPNIAPGETRTYIQAVNITNGGASPRTINMSFVSLSGPWSTNFEYINVTMFNSTGTQKGNSVEIASSGSNVTYSGAVSLPNGQTWTVRWIIKAKLTAVQNDAISITFKVKVED